MTDNQKRKEEFKKLQEELKREIFKNKPTPKPVIDEFKKRCGRCKRRKLKINFNEDKRFSDGLRAICILCEKEIEKEKISTNKPKPASKPKPNPTLKPKPASKPKPTPKPKVTEEKIDITKQNDEGLIGGVIAIGIVIGVIYLAFRLIGAGLDFLFSEEDIENYSSPETSSTTTTTVASTTTTTVASTTTTTAFIDRDSPTWTDKSINIQNINDTYFEVLWKTASDNVNVVGYYFYLNSQLKGEYIRNNNNNSIFLDGLKSGTTYELEIIAYDDEGNLSTDNPKATITTSGAADSSSNSSTNSSSSNTQSTTTTTTVIPFEVPTITELYLNGPSEISLGQDIVYSVNFTITTGTFYTDNPYGNYSLKQGTEYLNIYFDWIPENPPENGIYNNELRKCVLLVPTKNSFEQEFSVSGTCTLSSTGFYEGQRIWVYAVSIVSEYSQSTFHWTYPGLNGCDTSSNFGGRSTCLDPYNIFNDPTYAKGNMYTYARYPITTVTSS